MNLLRQYTLRITVFALIAIGIASKANTQERSPRLRGQLGDDVWKLRVTLSDDEYKALEPAAPQMGFGGPAAPASGLDQSDTRRETVGNLFGIQFPWVTGSVNFTSGESEAKSLPCRIRYDGDFTYTMAAQSPKRPMFIQLLDGHDIKGVTSFRLHTMQFDQTMLRERITSHVFASLDATVTRTTHAELSLKVGEKEPKFIGLYTILEAVDAPFLRRNGIPKSSLALQTIGLNTIRYAGESWNAYVRTFRSSKRPSEKQQTRIIAFAKLINEATDEEFDAGISEFINTDELLRYLAANSLTSNVTGMSTIGTNDILCLDLEGRFHIIANQMETALGGSILSGSPDELTNLRMMRPYAAECKLFDRLLANKDLRDRYLKIVRESVDGFFTPERMNPLIAVLIEATANSRERETQAAAERLRKLIQSIGGGIVPPRGRSGFGPPPMALSTFIEKRNDSIRKQLKGSEPGFTPHVPNFGGFGGGGSSGRRQGSTAPITDTQFRESVQVSEDFNATLFARSPEVNYPVAIAAEPTGAIYVASDEQGSLGTDKDGGKVLRCVDHDGDGVMDSVTTFCRVDHVRGVVYRDGAVWVSHPPYLSVFHDDDGDGVADGNQRLVSGLTTEMVNTRGGDHTTNGVRMGIDGWLYIGNGDYGTPDAEGIDGSTVVLRGGGILRVRPDGTELELFASGLRNPFDIAIDPQLNLFTRDNTNDGGGWDTRVSQLFQTAEYGYPRLFANFSDEIMPTLGVFGNGGGTGSLYIEDEAWPERWNRSLFTGDWGRSGVFHHPLTPDGATFQLTQQTFATISRATGMDLDASGNLYVASWWSGEASVHVGPHVGFVTRLTPKGSTPREFPNLSVASVPELIEFLRSPNAVVRFHVQGELLRRSDAAVGALSQVCRNVDFPLAGRIAALFAVKQIQGIR
ncbi:MAG: CotH kinase family protein, partial [Planctomycetota bacterium]